MIIGIPEIEQLTQEVKEVKELLIELLAAQGINANDLPDKGGYDLAEKITGLKRETLRNYRTTGKIPFHTERGKTTFYKSELLEWDDKGRPTVEEFYKDKL